MKFNNKILKNILLIGIFSILISTNNLPVLAVDNSQEMLMEEEIQTVENGEDNENSANADMEDTTIDDKKVNAPPDNTQETLEKGDEAVSSEVETENEISQYDLEQSGNEKDDLAWANREVIVDGVYVIGTQSNNRQVLDVENGSNLDGANVQIYESNSSKAQYWQVEHDEKGYVIFTNVGSGKVLDVKDAAASSRANVQQYQKNESDAQKWIAMKNPDGSIIICSALDVSLVLTIDDSSAQNCTNVMLDFKSGQISQNFCLYSTEVTRPIKGRTIADGTYSISGATGFLEVSEGNVRVNEKKETVDQAFYVSYDEGREYYIITSCSTGKLLKVESGDVVPGTRVVLDESSEKNEQALWSISVNDKQEILITNVANGQVIGVDKDELGDEVVVVPSDDLRASSWKIEKAAFYWAESELDSYALSKKDHPDLEEGIYQITTSLKYNMTLDVANASKANCANIQIYESNDSDAQRWRVEALGDGYVVFVNVGSGKVLDVRNSSKQIGVQIQQYERNDSRAQKWLPLKNSNGSYVFYSALGHGLVLDVSGAGTSNLTKIQTYLYNKTDAQCFNVYGSNGCMDKQEKVIESGYYTIVSAADSNKVLDLYNASSANGSPIQIYTANNSLAQCFYVEYSDDGYYRIRIGKTAKSLDLRKGGLLPGTGVQQWDYGKESENQKWVLSKENDGSLRIISAKNGLCVDGGDLSIGNHIDTQKASDSLSQKWFFVQYSPTISDGYYLIESSMNSQKVVDIANGSKVSGGTAQIYSVNKSLAQKWKIHTSEEGITLQNLGSGFYLSADGDKVCQLDTSGQGDSSRWMLDVQMGEGYNLVNKASGKVLSISNESLSNGNKIVTSEHNGGRGQAWNFHATNIMEEGFYEFAPLVNVNLRLDVAGGSRENGANVQVYTSNGTLSQKWWIKNDGNGWYTLTACCSAKMLDIQNGSSVPGANVQQYQANGSAAQKWRFEMGDRGIKIISSLGVVLDVNGGVGVPGANVWSQADGGTIAQQWTIYPSTTPSKIGWQNPTGYPQVSSRTVILPSYCTGYFTYVTPSRIAIDATRFDCINAFISRAYEYLGTRYIEPWSSWPGDAVDCSGLVLQCLYATGMDMGIYNPYNHRWLPGQTYNSMNWYHNNTFMPVSINNLQRGDLVYYKNHVAIYIGGGQIIDSWPGQGVTIQGLYSRGNVIGAQRPFV